MGSRNVERGNAAIEALVKEDARCEGKIELVQIDVCDQASITAAVESVKTKLGDKKLYALVNNAGCIAMEENGTSQEAMINTNVYGVKLVSEAFIPLIDPAVGRIVNLGSGMGTGHVSKCEDKEAQTMLSSGEATWQQLETYLKATAPGVDGVAGYGLTKAIVHKYTEISAKENPTLMISSVYPGFVNTNLSKGFGAKLTPEEGTKSTSHVLFADLEASGYYYGSDSVRSPLHFMRSPGDPAFEGYKLYITKKT